MGNRGQNRPGPRVQALSVNGVCRCHTDCVWYADVIQIVCVGGVAFDEVGLNQQPAFLDPLELPLTAAAVPIYSLMSVGWVDDQQT